MKCPNCKEPMVKVCSECGYTLTPYNRLLGKKVRLDKKNGTGFFYKDNILKIEVEEENEEWIHLGAWSFDMIIEDVMNEIHFGLTRHFDSLLEITECMNEQFGCKVVFQIQKTLFSEYS